MRNANQHPINLSNSSGRTQAFGLNQDLTKIRVHSGAADRAAAYGMNSKAYSQGSSVLFDSRHEGPKNNLLGHELSHVIQQRQGGVIQK